jgi:BlaI family penicillinase repressor
LQQELGRRERQIMEVLFRKGKASVADVRAELPDPPTYSAVRGMLRFLEDKGHVAHTQDGLRYLYRPVADQAEARQSALKQLVRTFFKGSPASAMAALLDLPDAELTARERRHIQQMIARAKEEK